MALDFECAGRCHAVVMWLDWHLGRSYLVHLLSVARALSQRSLTPPAASVLGLGLAPRH